MNNEFDTAMKDVRASFRLLYSFNRRILDLMKYISSRLGLTYTGGSPTYSDGSPRIGDTNLDRWGWDWLSLYFWEFAFSSGEYYFAIYLQCDTGSWDTSVDAREVEKYGDIENSKTRLIFVISKKDWDSDCFIDNENLKSSAEKAFTIPDTEIGDNTIFCQPFDISCFKDMKSTDEALQTYINSQNLKGFPNLKLQEKNKD